jgi:hypothetical protein
VHIALLQAQIKAGAHDKLATLETMVANLAPQTTPFLLRITQQWLTNAKQATKATRKAALNLLGYSDDLII